MGEDAAPPGGAALAMVEHVVVVHVAVHDDVGVGGVVAVVVLKGM